jgi:predicted RNA-binding protein Jag
VAEKMVKISGKTMEEAIQAACEKLGVTPEMIEVDVVRDATSGILKMITGS